MPPLSISGFWMLPHSMAFPPEFRCLVEAGADVNALDERGCTPLAQYLHDVAIPDALVVQALLDAGADPHRGNTLHQSLNGRNPSPDVTRLLIRHGADVSKGGYGLGRTPLHMLCGGASTNFCLFSQNLGILLEAGADMNAKDVRGETPLHCACRYWGPDPSRLDLLVTAGADVNAADEKGSTPLHVLAASSPNNPTVVANIDLLVSAGASVDAADANGCTPLHIAALRGNIFAMKALIAAGADKELLDSRGGGLLHYAACSSRPFPTSFLDATNLDINSRDDMGLSPLHWAAKGSPRLKSLGWMLKAGADIHARDHQGRTPLHHAARFGLPQLVELFISAGANADTLDQQDDTPLTLAARTGAYNAVIQLLKAGVSVPKVAIEFGEPLAICIRTSSWRSKIFSMLPRMVRFLKKISPYARFKFGTRERRSYQATCPFTIYRYRHWAKADSETVTLALFLGTWS
ncbi:hypothetical protein BOTBODRAFT_269324 [Botryobasidium botryosum FD-172 SS1]|uniref:Uncharacterized protein n=1 Tax=Botryobasidium botryosum (strain FD-172 SS1) TaxID=930990 RepID=A0A067MKQ6_BOTB1|nr:hypothetical protein BOTBODRAFT_269324 [Botryobasidium botryosum FD-172 SS1]